jgi:DNA-binding CsgD family transcriptional regulator
MGRGRPRHPELLTPRQQEVLSLLRDGLSNRQIAQRLGISISGAAYHVGEILSKLQVCTREEAANAATEPEPKRLWGFWGLLGPLGKAFPGSLLKLGSAAAIAGAFGSMVLLTVGVVITDQRKGEQGYVDCVTGQAALNPPGARGEENLRQEYFTTIEEAESFLCVRLPRVQLPANWQSRRAVTTVRSNSIAEFESGAWSAGEDAYKYFETYFGAFDRSIYVTLMVYPSDLRDRWESGPGCGSAATDTAVVEFSEVIIQASRSTLWVEPSPVGWPTKSFVCWERANLTFHAAMTSPPGVDVQSEIVPILESIE